ncbi:Superfamily II DNA helicase [Polynucleobacter duraquae]|uniref:Superfamily II DNA helicase n=1 Tax=Polynucleobacter duraquae TaxID=1835254 RepID=A0A0E3V0W1_9BURK|nr:HRDC domain-containing protein [Polynucleobacter duraquae]AKD24938.1 Superfamily II DNA helicase [Polynucleobacter duraquae]
MPYKFWCPLFRHLIILSHPLFGAKKGSTHPFSNIADERLWEILKAQRTELACEQGVPPYVIFHDSTLQEMVKSTPTTLDQFSHIGGVGQAKL